MFDVSTERADDGQATNLRNIMENLLGTTELYTVTNEDNRVYNFATSVNHSKWVSEIDLSGCTNIIVMDRLRLVPLYGVENPEPKFKLTDFVDKIIRKHG